MEGKGTARVASRAQLGLSAPRVQVEVHLDSGLPHFSIVGLPATAVKESKDRVRAALANSGFEWPPGRITVNLSPADLPKEGCRYDLPIALGILLASSQLSMPADRLGNHEFYGELGLAGELKPIRGVMLAAAHASREGRELMVPAGNLREASIAAPRVTRAAGSLLEVCEQARSREMPQPTIPALSTAAAAAPVAAELAEVRGQAAAKRALIIAAAGGHSLLLVGPPGTGKSMLAQRLPGILPPLEVASIASVSTRGFDASSYGTPPFRAPHHTASAGAIIGGGPGARPGEVSLAHRGVLFLDELPEFNRGVLESLREPLEAGSVTISRAALQVEYPAKFQLVAAMNPCPCGFLGEPNGRCRCTPPEIARYRGRISGPLLDRIDLRVCVPALSSEELLEETAGPARISSADAAACVAAARARQFMRAGILNAHLTGPGLQKHCPVDRSGKRLLAGARVQLNLSARGIHRVLRVARTIADMASAENIALEHLAEALQLRRALD